MARAKRKAELTAEEKLAAALVPEAEQPYKVPENWCWVRLGSAYEVNPSYDLPSEGEIAFTPMALVPQGLDSTPEYDFGDSVCLSKGYRRYGEGDVVFAKISPCFENRKSMIVHNLPSSVGVGSTELIVLHSDSIDPKFTYLLVIDERFIRDGAQFKGTVGQQRLRKGFVENYAVPLPPLPEQRRIVSRVESLFAKLDEAESKLRAILAQSEVRRTAILHDAFSGKLTKEWRKIHNGKAVSVLADIARYAGAWSTKDQRFITAGQINASDCLRDGFCWTTCTVGAVGRVTNGSTPSRKRPDYWDGTIPWVSSGEVRNNLIDATREFITQSGFDNSSVKMLPAGTVLIAMIGEGKTRGQSSVLEISATINQNVAAVVIDHGLVESRYLWYWFIYTYKNNRVAGSGSGPQALNCQRVRELPFVLAELSEQREIARRLDSLFAKQDAADARVNDALSAISTLRQTILARALRGELGTNDPAEESSLELLKTIL